MRALSSRDLLDPVPLLVRAFDDDPFFNFLAPNRPLRHAFLAEVMRSFLELSDGHARVAGEHGIEGVSVWLPPGKYPTPTARSLWVRGAGIARILARPPGTRGAVAQAVTRALRIAELLDDAHTKERYYYLQLLAVDPARQGRGIGSTILRELVADADREGLPALLETGKESNVRLYRRFGFEIVRTTRAGASPPLWTMRRPAQPERASSAA